MYKFIDSYGADADGNRSMPLFSYMIESSDTKQIQRQIIQSMDDSGELPTNPFTVSLIEPISEEQIDLEINPFEYFSKQECISYLNSIAKE